MESEFEIIGVYQNPHIAHILRTRLESEGINAWVTDENTIMNTAFYSDKVGGAKLQVRKKDAEEATIILNSIEQAGLN
ncbi:MAG: DUF2007 domain-containing protein [Bacteroidetes bacterium]|nr:DUF2007 domain-containing protein [Bacteroidota bacterium]